MTLGCEFGSCPASPASIELSLIAPPSVVGRAPGKSVSPFSLWTERHRPYSDINIFAEDVMAFLDERMGAPWFLTESRLVTTNYGLDLYYPNQRAYLLDLTNNAIQRQIQVLAQTENDEDRGPIETSLARLKAEREGLSRAIRLVYNYPDSWVVWISPPGMGLDSQESRVNLFKIIDHDQVVSISIVAADNLQAMRLYFNSIGGRLPDDAPISPISFLYTPSVTNLNLQELVRFLQVVNHRFGYTPPGMVRLPELFQAYPGLREKLEGEIINFFNQTYRINRSSYEEEVAFLRHLYLYFIVPYLTDYLQKKGYQVDVGYILALTQQPTGCGSFDAFMPGVVNPINPLVLASSIFNTLFGIECDECKKEKD